MKIESFEDIASWQKARELTKLVYRCSKPERFRSLRGAHAPSRVLTGALAGQRQASRNSQNGSPAEPARVLREGAQHRTRGRVRSPCNESELRGSKYNQQPDKPRKARR